jgi:FlaG/FlaF family flagellin (archaellin)
VILAAVIGTFVLGLGDQVQSSAPNANFQFEYGTVSFDDADADTTGVATRYVEITHNGGQDVEEDNVILEIASSPAYYAETPSNVEADSDITAEIPWDDGNTLSTGSSARLFVYDSDPSTDNGWEDDGSQSNTLGEGFSGFSDATAISGGESVRVIWESPNGDSSNTIGESTIPS